MFKDNLNRHGIGDTFFKRSRNIEKLLGFSKIFLKFEGGNPTGTMKDRASLACLELAKEKGYTSVAIASCGNFGASVVHISRDFGLQAHVYIPEGYHTPRISEMEEKGGVIHRVKGTYEDAVEFSTKEAERKGWFNANPGAGANTKASMEAYATISHEIHEGLGHAPDVVAVPVGNGTTFAGIHHGFKRLLEAGETDKVPAMIAASTTGGNPVVKCFLKGLKRIQDLDPSEITETEHNEPIVNWRSLDGQQALDALWDSNGWATYVSDDVMVAFSDILAKEEGLLVLPASASSLASLAEYVKSRPKRKAEKTYVAVLTARKY